MGEYAEQVMQLATTGMVLLYFLIGEIALIGGFLFGSQIWRP